MQDIKSVERSEQLFDKRLMDRVFCIRIQKLLQPENLCHDPPTTDC